MILKFPPLSGGTSIGLNDPGIETFEGNYAHYIVRECAQNSLDAASSSNAPVRLSFKAYSIDKDEIEFHGDLLNSLKSARDYWPNQPKAAKFFHEAIRQLDQRSTSFLRISDSGTTGVAGTDEDRDSPWNGLVKSRGVSIKEDSGSGGSFGIGKDAPLAGSACRTVLYSTKTRDGGVAFQGVTRLVTHLDGNGTETQGTGFIGNYDEESNKHSAIREELLIPVPFRRGTALTGLDIWIVGFKYPTQEWQQLFEGAALANFWPAIQLGKIEFEIGNQLVGRDSLSNLMEKWRSSHPVKNQFPFYQSIKSTERKEFQKKLETAGACTLRVLTGRELPRKIAMTRKTGMIIYPAPFRVLRMPFAGLFVCESDEGNALLKTLEPPSHDKWDESRNADDPRAKKSLQEIKHFIRESLKSLIPESTSDSFNEDLLSKYLPDEEDDELPDSSAGDDGEPDLGGSPKIDDQDAVVRPPSAAVVLVKSAAGDFGKNDGTGGGGSETPDGREGDGKNTGGKQGAAGGDPGTGGGSSSAPQKPSLKLRSWTSSSAGWDYDLVIRSSEEYSGNLLVMAMDEDGREEEVKVESAMEISTGRVYETVGNQVNNVTLPQDNPTNWRVKVGSGAKVSLRVKPA